MIHEIKDLNKIAVKRVKHTELILTISGRWLMCLQQKSPFLYICVCEYSYTALNMHRYYAYEKMSR